MDLKIEKDVPVPSKVPHTGFTALLRALAIGDSVLLPTYPEKANTVAYRVFGKGHYRSQKEQGGTRIWRIA